jgi:hypothetical protein
MKKKNKTMVTGERNGKGLTHFPFVTLLFQDFASLEVWGDAQSE